MDDWQWDEDDGHTRPDNACIQQRPIGVRPQPTLDTLGYDSGDVGWDMHPFIPRTQMQNGGFDDRSRLFDFVLPPSQQFVSAQQANTPSENTWTNSQFVAPHLGFADPGLDSHLSESIDCDWGLPASTPPWFTSFSNQGTDQDSVFIGQGQSLTAAGQDYQDQYAMSLPDAAGGRPAPEVALAADSRIELDLIIPGREITGKSILEDDSIEIDGRKYQGYKEDRYFLPNDPEEQDRLDMQHAMMTALLDNKLSCSPNTNPSKVLDIATGTGIWPIEFAIEHPQAEVIGTDLSLIQPSTEFLPPNVSFVKEDCEDDEWTIPRDFDLIHLRAVYTAIKDHVKLIRTMFKHLAPGGWIEIVEARPEVLSFDGTSVGSALERFGKMVHAGLVTLGREPFAITRYGAMMRDAGFVDYDERVLPLPTSGWPEDERYKEAGRYQGANSRHALLSGTMHRLFKATGLSDDEINQDIKQAVQEIEYGYVHGYWPIHIVHARKPPL